MAFLFEKSGKLKPVTAEELAEADKGQPVIVRDQGVSDDGRAYWIYVAIKPSRYQEFLRVMKNPVSADYRDYGEVLCYGYDKEIPANIKEEMKQKYGCDDNFMKNLEKEVEKEKNIFLKDQDAKETEHFNSIVEMMKNKK